MSAPSNLTELLAARAARAPEKDAIRFQHEAISYRALLDRAGCMAAGLARLGVGSGDPVCVLLDTSCDYVALWVALNWIGAVEVPINTALRGEALAHALRLTGAAVLVTEAIYVPVAISTLAKAPAIRRVIVRKQNSLLAN